MADKIIHLGERRDSKSELHEIIGLLTSRARAGNIEGLFVIDIGHSERGAPLVVTLSQTDLGALRDPLAVMALIGALEKLKGHLLDALE